MRTYDLREPRCASLAPDASLTETVNWAVAHAVLAPSELNSQPWLFRSVLDPHAQAATVELLLDETRLLPTVDPMAREAVLACGAALLNLRLALHGAGLGTTVRACPDPRRREVLAEIRVKGNTDEAAEDRPLRLAIPVRGTHRGAFEPAAVPGQLVDHLVAQAAYEGALVTVLDDAKRLTVSMLDERAGRQLAHDRAMRMEVAAWSRTNTSTRPDGVPGFAHGLSTLRSWLEPMRIRTGSSNVGEQEHRRSVDDAPVVLVIGAASESRNGLLRAGAGMQRLLLFARSVGLSASYSNAPLHVNQLRRTLGGAVGLRHPQVVLRMGYAELDLPVPRRPASWVLTQRGVTR